MEKILDKKIRESNRAACERSAAGQPDPAVAAAQAGGAKRRRRKKKKKESDNESDAASVVSERSDAASIASSTGTVVSALAVYDECREKGLCYKFQRNTCPHMATPDKCKYKHERCRTPLPDGWRKKGKGKGKGKGRKGSRSPSRKGGQAGSPDSAAKPKKPKSETPCYFHGQGRCTKGDSCEYKHS